MAASSEATFNSSVQQASLPKVSVWKEELALGTATALGVIAIYRVPSWSGLLFDPCHLASILCMVTIVAFHVTRRLGVLGIAIERPLVAVFLAGMPVIYIASWITTDHYRDYGWLWIELIGLPIYVGAAVFGVTRTPWLLAIGIMAHGLAWDVWHITSSPYIPSWYAVGCLMADIGIGVYVAVRIPAWHRAKTQVATSR
jgi:hypothetical protein